MRTLDFTKNWALIFKKCDFDAIFMITYAPGQSAFNIVERRMVPLSKELCEVLLKHDYFNVRTQI